MKPVIGLMPLVDVERESLWMLPGYMKGIELAGGIPVMLPLTSNKEDIEELLKNCKGLLFTGGQDVSPEIYIKNLKNDTFNREETIICCGERDEMELASLKCAMEKDMPVLGICRGIQFINAALGGTLYRDLPSQHPSAVCHRQAPPYNKPAHSVKVAKDTPLYELLGRESLEVNSYHHQAVKDIAPSLAPMALSADGLVEAVYKPDYSFLWALQWHPEFSFETDENSREIFRAFVKAASGYDIK
ncbi:MAG: gamma-glutamyl-gamma-aminobutyrate hydrolase family protein [Lachnospiraceae bacterium]|nr:gamma-glutamyl-gamma-aminobutyrate hydrolase family protein [Lachnospiraceae bacterium]